jgi:hypothetical protein
LITDFVCMAKCRLRVLHNDFLPERVEKLVVRDEAAGVVDQVLKQVIRTRPEIEPGLAPVRRHLPNALVGPIEPERREFAHFCLRAHGPFILLIPYEARWPPPCAGFRRGLLHGKAINR